MYSFQLVALGFWAVVCGFPARAHAHPATESQVDIIRLEVVASVYNWLGEETMDTASAWVQLDQALALGAGADHGHRLHGLAHKKGKRDLTVFHLKAGADQQLGPTIRNLSHFLFVKWFPLAVHPWVALLLIQPASLATGLQFWRLMTRRLSKKGLREAGFFRLKCPVSMVDLASFVGTGFDTVLPKAVAERHNQTT